MKKRSIRLYAHEVRAILDGRQTQIRRFIDCHCNRMHYDRLLGAWALSEPPFRLTQEEFDDGVWNWRWQGKDPRPGDWIECIQTDVDDNMYLPVWNPFDCDLIWHRSSPTLRIDMTINDVGVEARRNHAPDCKYRRAVEIPIGIECEHGRDVCPICDRCTCKEPRQ